MAPQRSPALLAIAIATAGCGAHQPQPRPGWSAEEIAADRSCRAGTISACTDLGRRLASREDNQKDRERGLVLLEMACGRDDLAACAALARDYIEHSRADTSKDRARTLATQACERRFAEACTVLGEIALHDNPRDIGGAAPSFERACEMGDAKGCELFGLAASRARDPGTAERGFAAACALGRRSSCHLLALRRMNDPATRRDGFARLLDNCAHGFGKSCAFGALLGSPVVSAAPSCPDALPLADKACALKDAVGCAVGDACGLEVTGRRDAALANLRQGCDAHVPIACLFWADAIEPRDGRSSDPAPDLWRVRGAYEDACRDRPDVLEVSAIACPRLAAFDLARATTSAEAERLLTELQRRCEAASGEACCLLAAEHGRGKWAPANADKITELRKRACDLGRPACCTPSAGPTRKL